MNDEIDSRQFEQDFTLDQLGNWETFKERDTDTGSTWDLDQDRAHNDVNEIDTDNIDGDADNPITTTTGTNWADPVYDAAGNTTTIPQPGSLASSYTLKYDAWNRLIEVKDGSTVVQKNEYDGLNRRIVRDSDDNAGDGDERHFYYSDQWQVVSEFVGSTADAIYSYHPHYIDAVALRMRDSGMHSVHTHFFLHDANFNVTAAVDATSGSGNYRTVVERYAYTAYGEVTVLDSDFSDDADGVSDIDNELLYTGRRLDPETGMQLNRRRYYHQQLGRWIKRDPKGYVDAINLYQYVQSQPVVMTDPSGTLSVCCRPQDAVPILGFIYHCQLRNECVGGETPHPVWPDFDPDRKMDNLMPCSQATKADIEACLRRNRHTDQPNCQANTRDRIGRCCLKSSWTPQPFTGHPLGPCDRKETPPWPEDFNTPRGCAKRRLPEWRDPNPPNPLPPGPPTVPPVDDWSHQGWEEIGPGPPGVEYPPGESWPPH